MTDKPAPTRPREPLVLPPNFHDVTAERVGTVVAIVGGTEAAEGRTEIGPGPAAPASPMRFSGASGAMAAHGRWHGAITCPAAIS